MYNITIKKINYNKRKKDFQVINILTCNKKELSKKIINLKKVYNDWNYIIEFQKI